MVLLSQPELVGALIVRPAHSPGADPSGGGRRTGRPPKPWPAKPRWMLPPEAERGTLLPRKESGLSPGWSEGLSYEAHSASLTQYGDAQLLRPSSREKVGLMGPMTDRTAAASRPASREGRPTMTPPSAPPYSRPSTPGHTRGFIDRPPQSVTLTQVGYAGAGGLGGAVPSCDAAHGRPRSGSMRTAAAPGSTGTHAAGCGSAVSGADGPAFGGATFVAARSAVNGAAVLAPCCSTAALSTASVCVAPSATLSWNAGAPPWSAFPQGVDSSLPATPNNSRPGSVHASRDRSRPCSRMIGELHAGSREGLYGGALSQQQLTGAMLMGGAADRQVHASAHHGAMLMGGAAGIHTGMGERGYAHVSHCSPTAIAVASTCHGTSPPPSSVGYGLVATDAGWYDRRFGTEADSMRAAACKCSPRRISFP